MPGDGEFVLEYQGCRLHARVEGKGPPVVFIQGTGLHGGGWRPQVEGLSSDHTCLSFDNRGVGASLPRATVITVEQMAADTLALMDSLGWQSAHLVGHSLGGLVARHVAGMAEERVRSLSLLCTFARGADATRISPGMIWRSLRTFVGTRRMRRKAFVEFVISPETLAETSRDLWAVELAPLFGHDLADLPPVVMKQLSAMRAYDGSAGLGDLFRMPCLVMGGEHDKIARTHVVRNLAEKIPGSRLVMFPSGAHGITIEHAERVNQLLAMHFDAAELAWSARIEEVPAGA